MKYNNIKIMGMAVISTIALASCSDSFLEDKKNYEKVGPEVYDDIKGVEGCVNDVYYWSLPTANSRQVWKQPQNGLSDDESKSTEEYSGFGCFVNPQSPMAVETNNVPDYFQGQANNIRESVWGRVRRINDVLAGISNGALSDELKNKYLGQVYFFRAWSYYLMFKWYGGVPIITEVKNPEAGSFTPRSTTKETYDFICSDLDKAVELLTPYTTNGGWEDAAKNYGRVTAGAAMALKGRVMLLWASPLFNRTNDASRWNAAYDYISKSISVINQCGNSLYGESNPGVNASAWADMFTRTDQNPEAVFLQINNTIADGGTPDYSRNNGWENAIRPSNTMGGGGITPSAMMVDLFPMKDGKRPATLDTYSSLEASGYTYDPELPFVDRDPRFYRTFAFPGVRWTFNGNPTSESNHNPYEGKDYILWNYVWYENAEQAEDVEGKAYGTDGLLANAKGFYVRKRTDDYDVRSASNYIFESTGRAFKRNAAPYIEIRYAEVLLNLAEAACGAGHMDVAVEQLKKIRQRVGYTGDCGLDPAISGSQAKCMAAVLYERQIELAYEGKRFDDMRRWMLFDGGAEKVEGAPSSWSLTGWGGNTCTYLGVKPMNDQRRENLEFRLKSPNDIGGTNFGSDGSNPDPLFKVISKEERDAYAIDLRNDVYGQQDNLKTFYQTYLTRKMKKGDARTSDKVNLYIKFKPNYYFIGLSRGAMGSNIGIEQTIGWGNSNQGNAPGTFDPLAE